MNSLKIFKKSYVRVFSLSLGLLFVSSLQANPLSKTSLEVLTEVLTSAAVKKEAATLAKKNYTSVVNVERTLVARCLGCFEYQLTFLKVDSKTSEQSTKQVTVKTRRDLTSGALAVEKKVD